MGSVIHQLAEDRVKVVRVEKGVGAEGTQPAFQPVYVTDNGARRGDEHRHYRQDRVVAQATQQREVVLTRRQQIDDQGIRWPRGKDIVAVRPGVQRARLMTARAQEIGQPCRE